MKKPKEIFKFKKTQNYDNIVSISSSLMRYANSLKKNDPARQNIKAMVADLQYKVEKEPELFEQSVSKAEKKLQADRAKGMARAREWFNKFKKKYAN